ncbi:serine phosphatase RsbU (regulator of sigma subunit) [Allocatelliglobosispora scoriae]|uniref:Serine phosphatase RsbU (Regulator of sigma subunit) n=1 Tax=Allocatelliglobosispora scoriae TaxID=643052 RepID=A0A841BM66_9ACTN|nr:SpoIIE family protein phosphatase [Allocatelliglobosispora scoriae]MBB5868755.1 serine phosphatase RsbU (regulator of sigma subunit) [Allocatelliglobosispora scoriae]
MPGADHTASEAAIEAVLAACPPATGADSPAYVDQVLMLLGEHLRADGCALLVDRNDGTGLAVEASWGQPLREGTAVRVALSIGAPWHAQLLVGTPDPQGSRLLTAVASRLLGLALDMQRLYESDQARQQSLTFLVEVSDLLTQSLDLALTTALIPRLVVPRLGSWAALYLGEPGGEHPLVAVSHVDENATTDMFDRRHELGRSLATARLAAVFDAPPGSPLPAPLSGFAVPLLANGQRIGALVIGREHRPPLEDMILAEELARRASAAITNARLHEERRRIAHTLQQSLLPKTLPWIPRVDVGACYLPSGVGTEVGGDLYDVMAMPDGRWLAYVGDVSGKGIQAAAMTGFVRDVIRILVADGKPVPTILSILNTTLFERAERYITLALTTIDAPDLRSGVAEVTVYLAGHDAPLLLHADAEVTSVGVGGTALGLVASTSATAVPVSLSPGDTLVFHTDGVTERRRGREFLGRDRVCATLSTLAGHPAEVIAERIASLAKNFSAEPVRDDIAVLAVRNAAS